MLSFEQLLDRLIEGFVLFSFELEIDEESVGSIRTLFQDRLLCNGNETGSFLPCAFGKELFHPQTKRGERWRGDDRHLIAPTFRKTPHGRSQIRAGVCLNVL